MSARVEWLNIAGDPAVWRSLGLTVTDTGLIPLLGTSLRIASGPVSAPLREVVERPERNEFTKSEGIGSWALSGLPALPTGSTIDGLTTEIVDPAGPAFADHELGAIGLDHVVVLTSSIERTSAAIDEATGCPLKRVRDLGAMRQGFHRIGPGGAGGGLIVELVERAKVTSPIAQFWGLVINVDDLHAACALLGPDRVGTPKDAVQPGRRIATLRADVGLGLPVALMTP